MTFDPGDSLCGSDPIYPGPYRVVRGDGAWSVVASNPERTVIAECRGEYGQHVARAIAVRLDVCERLARRIDDLEYQNSQMVADSAISEVVDDARVEWCNAVESWLRNIAAQLEAAEEGVPCGEGLLAIRQSVDALIEQLWRLR